MALRQRLLGRFPFPPAIAVALLLLLAVAGTALWTQQRATDASNSRRQTLTVRIELAAFGSDLKDLSRAVRGYVISGREDWLAPYRTARHQLPERLRRLRSLTVDNPVQQQRLQSLQPLLDELLEFVAQTLVVADRDSLEAARQRIAAGTSRPVLATIETLLAQMDEEELRLLALREAAVRRSTQLDTAVMLLGSLMSLGLVAWAGTALQRSVGELRGSLERLARARSAESEAMAQLQRTQDSLHAANDALQVQARQLVELNEALWQWMGVRAAPAAAGGARLDDPERLAALQRTALMDSPPEEGFDRFTRLAAQSLQVPVCLISLVDERRQFFKSVYGLAEPWAGRRQTPLSHSLCQIVVTTGQALELPDAQQDPALRDCPAVTELGARAYLGVPLATPDGQVLGSFCAIDARPRAWSAQDRATLERIAQSVLAGIAVRMQLHELERRVAERTAEKGLLAGAIKHSLTGFSIVDAQGRFTYVNDAQARLWGYPSPEAMVGTGVGEHCADPALPRRINAALREQGACRLDFTARRRDGTRFEVLLDARLMHDEHGRRICVATVLDITERQRAEQALRMSEERLRLALDAARMDAFELEPVTGVVLRIGNLKESLGLTPEEQHLWKPFLRRLHPEDRPRLEAAAQDLSPVRPSYRAEYRLRGADGDWRWLLERSRRSFGAGGEPGRITGVVVDITESKRDEDRLKASLEEKDVLLQEVHHRVKNNLQVVSSLLQLQRRQLKDPAVQAAFVETENRVRAMALVHQRLYQQSSLSALDFAEYLRSLAAQLMQSFGSERLVRVEFELEPLHLPVGVAIPLGLIVTELITNALKYGLAQRGGVLGLTLQADGAQRLLLLVRDDGPGLPADFDPARSPGLGMRLVKMLSRQIGAEVGFERARGGGTCCRITAPLRKEMPELLPA